MELNQQQQEKLKKLNLHGRINRFLESKGIKYYVEVIGKENLEDGSKKVYAGLLPQHDNDRLYDYDELNALLKPEFKSITEFYVTNNYKEKNFYEFLHEYQQYSKNVRYRSCLYYCDGTIMAESTKYGNEWAFDNFPIGFADYDKSITKKGNYVAWKEDGSPYWTYALMSDDSWFDIALNAPRDANVRIYNDKDEDFWDKAESWVADAVENGGEVTNLRYMTKDEVKNYRRVCDKELKEIKKLYKGY
jgi:hypothetical protein